MADPSRKAFPVDPGSIRSKVDGLNVHTLPRERADETALSIPQGKASRRIPGLHQPPGKSALSGFPTLANMLRFPINPPQSSRLPRIPTQRNHTMIHHQAFHPPKDRRKPVKWWAVQTPSLAVARCTIDAGRLHLGHVPRPVPVAVHLTGDPPPDNGPVDKAALAAELLASVRENFDPELRLGRSADLDETPPEHILITDLRTGTLPGILRTGDPCFIAWPEPQPPLTVGPWRVPVDPPCGILGAPVVARSSRQLPVAGWQYWWEEAQDALESLTAEWLAEERRCQSNPP